MMDFFLDDMPHDGFSKGNKVAGKSNGEDNIEKIFTKINAHLTPEVAKGTNACFLFIVKGNCKYLTHFTNFFLLFWIV